MAEAAHAAWNAEDIEAVLGQYVDDLVYVSNAGGKNGKKLVVRGRSGLRELLTPVLPFIQNRTTIEAFMFRDDVGSPAGIVLYAGQANRARTLRDVPTNHAVSGLQNRPPRRNPRCGDVERLLAIGCC
jgi:hypothetical protein